jgi:cystathionine gamma-synthase
VVYFPPVSDESVLAKQFWQHTGEGISSRQADFIVRQRLPNPRLAQYDDVVSKIKDRLAKLYFGEENYDSGNVFIFPSGMSAIYNSHRSLLAAIKAEAVAVQFGFPYLDTWKILEKFSVKSVLLGKGNEDDILELERLASTEPLLGVFLEVPRNPLLLTPDLERLGHLSKKYGFPLIIDDTIGTVFNMDLLNNFCDIVVTSLTKYFSGACNVMAGKWYIILSL